MNNMNLHDSPQDKFLDDDQSNTVTVGVHEERLKWIVHNCKEVRGRIDRLEERYEAIFELASSIKSLAIQVETVNTNVTNMKNQFNEDITEIKEHQKQIGAKVGKIEKETERSVEIHNNNKKMKNDLIKEVCVKCVEIILIILLLQLFPHLSSIIN